MNNTSLWNTLFFTSKPLHFLGLHVWSGRTRQRPEPGSWEPQQHFGRLSIAKCFWLECLQSDELQNLCTRNATADSWVGKLVYLCLNVNQKNVFRKNLIGNMGFKKVFNNYSQLSPSRIVKNWLYIYLKVKSKILLWKLFY